ncbi:MAG: hypothetical protein ACE5GA_09530 [Candidatus Zixiibacteriota bacterium]
MTVRANHAMTLALILLLTGSLAGCGGRAALKRPTIFYPPLPQQPRIQFLTHYQNSDDLGAKSGGFRQFITGETTFKQALNKPHDVAYYDGKLYVCDSRRSEVVIMDIVNKKISSLGAEEGIAFGKPIGISISADGDKYIADNFRKRVYVFDSLDRFSDYLGEDGQFGPTSVAVYGDRLYVADPGQSEVEVLQRRTGETIEVVKGSDESEFGPFRMPVNLAVDYQGNLYVSDLLANTIHVFDSELNYLRNIGRPGDTYGTFARARGVAVDSSGYVYAADAAFENVQIFDPQGTLNLFFGGPGTAPGNMYLPSGISISYENLEPFSAFVDRRFDLDYVIFVANQYGPNGVSVYGFGGGKSGNFKVSGGATRAPQEKPSLRSPADTTAERVSDSASAEDER